MQFKTDTQLIEFLTDELAISNDSINLARRQSQSNDNLVPMVLWQYGLVTLCQLERIWDWLETV